MAAFRQSSKNTAQEKLPEKEEVIEKLREAAALLEKKCNLIVNKIESEINAAKKNTNTNKELALRAVKRKKRLEKELTKLDEAITAAEFHIEAVVEHDCSSNELISAKRLAINALRAAEMNPDKIDDILEEIAENKHEKINICQIIPCIKVQDVDEMDDDELEAELKELQNEDESFPVQGI